MKMIVVDLDGTLLNESRKVSENTKRYLKYLKEKGYIITIATGRNYSSVMKSTDQALFANYVITDTGACIYDLDHQKTLLKNYIDKTMVKEILNDYNHSTYRHIFICDKNILYKCSKEIENNDIIKTITDKEIILNKCIDVSHISIEMKNNNILIDLYRKLIKKFPNLDITIMQDSFADRKWLDIMPKNCSKYRSIQKLSEYLRIKNKDIIAFGDGLNDIEMIKNCGYGVALKNALDEVKEISDDITSYDNNHDGVINHLIEYL